MSKQKLPQKDYWNLPRSKNEATWAPMHVGKPADRWGDAASKDLGPSLIAYEKKAQTYDEATQLVLQRFRDRVKTTLAMTRDLNAKCYRMERALIYADDGRSDQSLYDGATAFQSAYKELLLVRDDPNTPFMTQRIIEVDTSTFGADDDQALILYHTDAITDPAVRREMEQNDGWYTEDWGSGYHADTPEQAILRRDELEMARIRNGVDKEADPALYLLKYAGLYHYLNNALGVDVATLPEGSRLQLVEYLADASKDDIGKIADVAGKLPEAARKPFAETFLATEFGDDFGGVILDIAEHAAPEQSAHIFETIGSLRMRTKEYAKIFAGIDPQLATATEKALNERITDALVALREVALRGLLHEDTAPHRNAADYVHDGKFDIDVHSMNGQLELLMGLKKRLLRCIG